MNETSVYDLKGLSCSMTVSCTVHGALVLVELTSCGAINANWSGGLDELCEFYVMAVELIDAYVVDKLLNASETCAAIKEALALMKKFCRVLRNNYKALDDRMDKELNNSRWKEFRPLYGVRRYQTIGYSYECSTLIQFCFAVIDILQKMNTGRSANTYIDACTRCGRPYVAHNRNTKYCPCCAKQNNAASSKKSSARGRTGAEKLEHKIKTKLRHHQDSCSSVKYESDNEKLARKLKDLFNEKDKERKAQYVEWLNSCFAYIMPKDADYKGLYDFLMK